MAVERPFTRAAAVTKSDATVFNPPARRLWVGGVGDVTVRTAGGDTVTYTAVAAGSKLDIAVDQVKNATTATLIVREW